MTGATQEKMEGSLGEGKLKAVREFKKSLVNSSTMTPFFPVFLTHTDPHMETEEPLHAVLILQTKQPTTIQDQAHQEQLQDLQKMGLL